MVKNSNTNPPRFTVCADGSTYELVTFARLSDLCGPALTYEAAVEAYARAVVCGDPLRVIDARGYVHDLDADAVRVLAVWPAAGNPIVRLANECGDEFCRCADCDDERAEWLGTVDAAAAFGARVRA